MAEFVTKKGVKFIYKDEITTRQLLAMQRQIKTNGEIDAQVSSDALVSLLIEKIILNDGSEHAEPLEIKNIFGDTNSKDGLKLIQLLGKVINEDDSDPKELASV